MRSVPRPTLPTGAAGDAPRRAAPAGDADATRRAASADAPRRAASADADAPAATPWTAPPGERRLHAMKNSLAVLNAGLALLEGAVDPAHRERLRVTRAAADDLLRLVQDELAGAAAEPPRELVDLADVAREACQSFGPLASAGGVALACDVEPCNVVGDRRALAEALGNLVLNAIEATPPSGSVRVEARRAAAGAELRVIDTGRGMSAEALARSRGGRFTTRRGGSGLGLAIARRAVEEQGGELRLESAPGAGTRVTMALGRG
jgi:signal transduction histidine kinase